MGQRLFHSHSKQRMSYCWTFIAKVLEEGGFARGQVQRPYWNVLSPIDYHLESSKSSKRIVEINGLIGKADWPKEMFVWRSEP
jgi:hypothetical protein